MARAVLFDNDAILKLAEYDILNEACQVLGVLPTKAVVLPSAVNVLKSKLKKVLNGTERRHTEKAVRRAIKFAEQAAKLEDAPESNVRKLLNPINAIDIGEELLLAYATETDSCVVLTGDKRCLKALAKAEGIESIYCALNGRVCCLEEVIRAVVAKKGKDYILQGVKTAPECDIAVTMCFGDDLAAPHESVISALERRIDELSTSVGDGWLYQVPYGR